MSGRHGRDEPAPDEKRRSEDPGGASPLGEGAPGRVADGRPGQGQRQEEAVAAGADPEGPLEVGGGHRPRPPERPEQREAGRDGPQGVGAADRTAGRPPLNRAGYAARPSEWLIHVAYISA